MWWFTWLVCKNELIILKIEVKSSKLWKYAFRNGHGNKQNHIMYTFKNAFLNRKIHCRCGFFSVWRWFRSICAYSLFDWCMQHIKFQKIPSAHRSQRSESNVMREKKYYNNNIYNHNKSTHLNAFLTAKVCAQTLYGYVYLKTKSKIRNQK